MIKKDGSEITDPLGTAEKFNQFFVSIGSSLANDLPETSWYYEGSGKFDEICF